MVQKSENASKFNRIAALVAFCLVVAAAFFFLQSRGGNPSSTELVALSQAMPRQAAKALAGDTGAFDALRSSVRKVSALSVAAVPGRASDWQQLQDAANSILGARDSLLAFGAARETIKSDSEAILQMSDALLERSGSTAIIQEFQQRADRLRQTANSLPDDAASALESIVADAGFVQAVFSALSGEPSNLDIRALGNSDRDAALAPIADNVASLGEQGAALRAHVDNVTAAVLAGADLTSSADRLLGAASGTAAGILPGYLGTVWLPLGALGVALLLLIVLFLLHKKAAAFERNAREHAEQNERNQQAILRLLDEMGSLADGDLTVEATVTEDITGTIADSFNFAIEELRTLVATVNETALMVDAATKQTENTAANLAIAAENQAKEIKAATDSVVSMASSIEEVSGNAERSSDVARHSVEVAHKGGEAVRRTIDGMNAIRETIQETSKRIKRLGESSQEIGNIVELINDIAEQTNILALNASIQASMAGEAGRGFAVVADEVQRLAERSTNATKQIEVLVRTIQSDTNEAVVSMERSTTDVVGGALLAENAGAALDEIEQVSNQIASLVQNISSSALQQASSAADVTKRTQRLREIGEQTGAATSVTAESIANLSELATELRKTVEGFTLPADMLQRRSSTSDVARVGAPANDEETNPRAQAG
jgi:twitching motility protein PilJ